MGINLTVGPHIRHGYRDMARVGCVASKAALSGSPEILPKAGYDQSQPLLTSKHRPQIQQTPTLLSYLGILTILFLLPHLYQRAFPPVASSMLPCG